MTGFDGKHTFRSYKRSPDDMPQLALVDDLDEEAALEAAFVREMHLDREIIMPAIGNLIAKLKAEGVSLSDAIRMITGHAIELMSDHQPKEVSVPWLENWVMTITNRPEPGRGNGTIEKSLPSVLDRDQSDT